MKILTITHLSRDEQADLVEAKLQRQGAQTFRLCSNGLNQTRLSYDASTDKVTLEISGESFVPDSIWYATHPRPDSVYAPDFEFPGEHRKNVSQFLNDLDHAFAENTKFLPSQLNEIGRADSKPWLFSQAVRCGFTVPELTMNGDGRTMVKNSSGIWYRKSLGYPAVITFSRKQQNEVVVTAKNSIRAAKENSDLWQWQTPIESTAHIRCCVVGKLVKAVIWKRNSLIEEICDFRSYHSKIGDDVWVEYQLPDTVQENLLRLTSSVQLGMCCPEFLLQDNGTHVFLDMNPCGDWLGFFGEKAKEEITSAVCDQLLQQLT